jgi:hypothetical protein
VILAIFGVTSGSFVRSAGTVPFPIANLKPNKKKNELIHRWNSDGIPFREKRFDFQDICSKIRRIKRNKKLVFPGQETDKKISFAFQMDMMEFILVTWVTLMQRSVTLGHCHWPAGHWKGGREQACRSSSSDPSPQSSWPLQTIVLMTQRELLHLK